MLKSRHHGCSSSCHSLDSWRWLFAEKRRRGKFCNRHWCSLGSISSLWKSYLTFFVYNVGWVAMLLLLGQLLYPLYYYSEMSEYCLFIYFLNVWFLELITSNFCSLILVLFCFFFSPLKANILSLLIDFEINGFLVFKHKYFGIKETVF